MNPNNSFIGANTPGASVQSTIPQAPAQTPAPAQTGNQPNWWEKLIPTAGGIIGGIGGGLAGAFIPGAGETGLSEYAGGVAGSAAGGAAGKALENWLTGQKDIGSGVGASAVENGAGQAVGGALAKGGGMLLDGAKGLLEKTAADRAAQTAQAVDNVPWQGIAGSAAAKNSDLEGTLNKMGEYGIGTHPDNLASITPQITGKDGAVLSDLVRGGMAKSTNPVDIGGTVQLASNIAGSPELASEGPTVGKAFVNTVNQILGLDKNGLTTKNAAGDIYQARQLLMDKAYGKGTSDALSSAYHDVANSLDGALSRSGVDSVVGDTGITPEQFQTLHAISPQLATEATAAAQNGVGALRTLQRPFVNASNLARAQAYHAGGQLPGTIAAKTAQAAGSSGPGILDAAGILGMPATHGLSAIIPAVHMAMKTVKNPGIQDAALGALTKATGNATAQKVVPALARSGAIAAANLPNDGATPQAATPGVPTGAIPSNIGGTMQPQSPLEQAMQIAQQNIQANQAAQAMDQTYASNAPLALSGMANSAASAGANATSGINNLNTSLVPLENKQALVAPVIANNQTAFANAGGAQGALGGGLSMINSLIPGTAANTYQRESEAAAATIANALGIRIEEARKLVPQLMQSQGSADVSSGGINSILGALGAPQGGSAIPQLQH